MGYVRLRFRTSLARVTPMGLLASHAGLGQKNLLPFFIYHYFFRDKPYFLLLVFFQS